MKNNLFICPNCGEQWYVSYLGIQNTNLSKSIFTSLNNNYEYCPNCEDDNDLNWVERF